MSTAATRQSATPKYAATWRPSTNDVCAAKVKARPPHRPAARPRGARPRSRTTPPRARTQGSRRARRPGGWCTATRRCCRAPRRRARRRARGSRRSSPTRRRHDAAGTADMIAAVIGDIDSAMPVSERDRSRPGCTSTACAGRACAKISEAGGDQQHARARTDAVGAEAGAQPRRERRDDDHDRRHRQQADRGAETASSRARAGSTA